MAIITNAPLQVPSDSVPVAPVSLMYTGNNVLAVDTQTVTIQNVTPLGADGSATFVDGALTSYTPPT